MDTNVSKIQNILLVFYTNIVCIYVNESGYVHPQK